MAIISIKTAIIAKTLLDKQKALIKAGFVTSTNCVEMEGFDLKAQFVDNAIKELCCEIDEKGYANMANIQDGDTVKFDISISTLGLAKVLMENAREDIGKVFGTDDEDAMFEAVEKIERIEKALDEINRVFCTTEL